MSLFEQVRLKPFFILGPCVMENQDLLYTVAEKVAELGQKYPITVIFKSSFDKANRTSIHSYRGPGIEKGMEMLQKVKERFGLPVTTDIHEPYQAAIAAEAVDILQIPAFLCRQTDLLIAAANTGKVVKIKKGQFLAPWDMKNVVAKVTGSGNPNVLVTERGASFGYNTLVVDMTSLPKMAALGAPVVMDATHSVQQPGGQGDRSGGEREMAPYIARAAVAAGVAAVFIETHNDPEDAAKRGISDAANMLWLKDVPDLLGDLVEIDRVAKRPHRN